MATSRKTVLVSQDIIDEAIQADSGHCMIAEALRQAFPDKTHISVDLATIRMSDPAKGERSIWLTPRPCQEKLLMFDQGLQVSEWSFKLPWVPNQIVPIRKRTIGQKRTSSRKPSAVAAQLRETEARAGIPVVRGGQTPPASVLSSHPGRRTGMKRAFGLKMAGGFNPLRQLETVG